MVMSVSPVKSTSGRKLNPASAVLTSATVPLTLTVPEPLPVTVPELATVRVPLAFRITVTLSPSVSATETPPTFSRVSSVAVSLAGAVITGSSFATASVTVKSVVVWLGAASGADQFAGSAIAASNTARVPVVGPL